MKEIVEEVLRVEEKAAEMLRNARLEAAKIRSSSETKASEQLSDAKKEAKEHLQRAVETAKNEAEDKRKETVEKATADFAARDITGTGMFDRAVSAVVDIITKPEFFKEG